MIKVVTMPLQEEEAPRLAEIGRRITQVGENLTDFRAEVRTNFAEMVRRETYVAERDAMKERIMALENSRRSMLGILFGSLAAVAVSIITMWVTRGGS